MLGADARRQLHPGAAGLDPSAQPLSVSKPSLLPFSPALAHDETSSGAGRQKEHI